MDLAWPGVAVDLPVWGDVLLLIAAVLTVVFALVRLLKKIRR
ncbi:hypothetical protein [Streptomyces sp. NPDC014764]